MVIQENQSFPYGAYIVNAAVAWKPKIDKKLQKAGHSGFLTFTDLYRLDTDILITFLWVLSICHSTDLFVRIYMHQSIMES